ncbi:MAG TPA: exosortase H [Usitatibacter sp.]|nr:exosortase H [Usitatibacter sp.]
MRRFALLFATILVFLFAAELTPPGQAWVVAPWTSIVARTAAAAAGLVDPSVMLDGATLLSTSTGFAVTILAGCNGLEATIVLIAAVLAYPAPWRSRLIGLAAGSAAIALLNLVRVVSLFYIGQWSPTVFEWAHLYVWQVLIMLDALIVWLVWLRTLPRAAAR